MNTYIELKKNGIQINRLQGQGFFRDRIGWRQRKKLGELLFIILGLKGTRPRLVTSSAEISGFVLFLPCDLGKNAYSFENLDVV